MPTRFLIPLLALLIPLASFAQRPLSRAMPKGAVAYAELRDLGAKLIQLRDSEYVQDLMELPQVVEAMKERDSIKALAVKTLVESYLDLDIWTLAEVMLSEIAVGLYPQDGGEPAPIVMFRINNAEVWTKVRERLDPILILADDQVERRKEGDLEYLDFGDELHIVLHEKWAVASSKAALLKSAVAGLTGKGKTSVARQPSFRKMEGLMGAEHMLRVWLDLASFRSSPDDRLNVPEKYDDGFASLIFSGIIELGLKSDFLGLTLDADEKGVQLTTFIDGDAKELGDDFGWFFSDADSIGARPLPAVKGLMGGFTIHRDVAGWYNRREDLLVENLQPEFDKFESGVGNLFPGRSITEDVIPTFGNSFTLLAAEQTFEHLDGAPGIKLPGFAVIFDLNKPEDATMFQLVFQTVVTILNFAGAEEGKMMRGPSVMTAVVHDGIPVNTIQFLQKPKGERLDISYNFIPSSATVNGRFIFSSSLPLCKALVDEIKKPQVADATNRNFNFELHPNAIAPLVKTNRSTLLSKSIQQGKTAEEARQEIDFLQSALEYFKLFGIRTSVLETGFQLQLTGKW